MPSLEENYKAWNQLHDWNNLGEEWSSQWGNSYNLWHYTIYRRIGFLLPTCTVLEIAPGHGRFTHFLRNHCKKLYAVDISYKCIDACKKRFKDVNNMSFHLTDGKSLDVIPDKSIDLIFSWDSLVHADRSVFESYISQFPRIMTDSACGFIHHSNMAEHAEKDDFHWRDETMSSIIFKEICEKNGINVFLQEKINWRCDITNDCFSFFSYKNDLIQGYELIENKLFMHEASVSKLLWDTYGQLHIKTNQ